LEAQIAVQVSKSACFVERHHLEHAIHADRRIGLQSRAQAAQPFVPKHAAKALTAHIGPHDKQAHKPGILAVRNDRAAAHAFVSVAESDQGLGIERPGGGDVG